MRSLSFLFTPSMFNQIVKEKNVLALKRKIKNLNLNNKRITTYQTLFKYAYSQLEESYRSEYLFKNSLINEYLLKKYSLNTTTVFNEFKIGSSIADMVLLNGTAKVFEIKTDLDGFDKLKKQVNDYIQFADFVYVVTSEKNIEKVLNDFSNTTIGVIEFTESNTLKERKRPVSNQRTFNHLALFKTLRKTEYLELITEQFGYIPDVPNTMIFRECLKLSLSIKVEEFQKLVFKKLKDRKIKCPDLLASKKTPYELKQICHSLDFSEFEYLNLYQFLNKSI